MPPINHAAFASVGIIAASVAVAAAIAIYESPEVRRMTEDLRRRIAIALYSLGDNVGPNRREPRFNRPEDAEGFYQSHDVDADDETRRRQREELMYWNERREEQKRREREESQKSPSASTFDDFLQPDKAGESGSYVYNTGSNAWNTDSSNLLRRRGNAEGLRGFNAAMAADNLSSEYGIELDEKPWAMEEEHAGLLSRGHDEAMSDIYNATPLVRSPTLAQSQALPQPPSPPPRPAAESEVLFDFDHHSELYPPSEYATAAEGPQFQPQPQPVPQPQSASAPTPTPTSRSATLERELADDEYMTAGQDDRGAYASIQAWAQNSSNTAGFYSPLPVSPPAPLSEPEIISEGQLTPTDSASVAGSGVHVAHDAVSVSAAGGDDGYDVMSQTDSWMPTPNSWSEVGSVVSESESAVHA